MNQMKEKSNAAFVSSKNDCTELTNLSIESVVENLRQRYLDSKIYTYVGSVLFAVNPYANMSWLYGKSMSEKYVNRSRRGADPHPYGLAEEAVRHMLSAQQKPKSELGGGSCYQASGCETNQGHSTILSHDSSIANQIMIVSGESGAGKTETCKVLVDYVLWRLARESEPGKSRIGAQAKADLTKGRADATKANSDVPQAERAVSKAKGKKGKGKKEDQHQGAPPGAAHSSDSTPTPTPTPIPTSRSESRPDVKSRSDQESTLSVNSLLASDIINRHSVCVLESFGNASTIRNLNSSRFGKLVKIQSVETKANQQGSGVSHGGSGVSHSSSPHSHQSHSSTQSVVASIEHFLLERCRLLAAGPGERSFHVFYQVMAIASILSDPGAHSDWLSSQKDIVTTKDSSPREGLGVIDSNTQLASGSKDSVGSVGSNTPDGVSLPAQSVGFEISGWPVDQCLFDLKPWSEYEIFNARFGAAPVRLYQDGAEFVSLVKSMAGCGLSEKTITTIVRIVVGIVKLSNVRFVSTDDDVNSERIDRSDSSSARVDPVSARMDLGSGPLASVSGDRKKVSIPSSSSSASRPLRGSRRRSSSASRAVSLSAQVQSTTDQSSNIPPYVNEQEFFSGCTLLGLTDADSTSLLFTLSHRFVGTTAIQKTPDSCNEAFKSFLSILYKTLFESVVKSINARLTELGRGEAMDPEYDGSPTIPPVNDPAEAGSFIGILDIFGFECLERNSLEQLFINTANETLQLFYTTNLMLRERLLYDAEGIQAVTDSDGVAVEADYASFLPQISKLLPFNLMGITGVSKSSVSSMNRLSMLVTCMNKFDDACAAQSRESVSAEKTFAKSMSAFFGVAIGYAEGRRHKDETRRRVECLTQKETSHFAAQKETNHALVQKDSSHPLTGRSAASGSSAGGLGKQLESLFAVNHYAGKVVYETTGWLAKNVQKFSSEVDLILKRSLRYKELVDGKEITRTGGAGAGIGIAIGSSQSVADSSGPSVSLDKYDSTKKVFSRGLEGLVATLASGSCHYVRCFTPNPVPNTPQNFMPSHVSRQVEACGTKQLIEVMKLGYPLRVSFKSVSEWYGRVTSMSEKHATGRNSVSRDQISGSDSSSRAEVEPCSTSASAALSSQSGITVCKALMEALSIPTSEFAVGITMLFLKNSQVSVSELLNGYISLDSDEGRQVLQVVRKRFAKLVVRRVLISVRTCVAMNREVLVIRRKRILNLFARVMYPIYLAQKMTKSLVARVRERIRVRNLRRDFQLACASIVVGLSVAEYANKSILSNATLISAMCKSKACQLELEVLLSQKAAVNTLSQAITSYAHVKFAVEVHACQVLCAALVKFGAQKELAALKKQSLVKDLEAGLFAVRNRKTFTVGKQASRWTREAKELRSQVTAELGSSRVVKSDLLKFLRGIILSSISRRSRKLTYNLPSVAEDENTPLKPDGSSRPDADLVRKMFLGQLSSGGSSPSESGVSGETNLTSSRRKFRASKVAPVEYLEPDSAEARKSKFSKEADSMFASLRVLEAVLENSASG